jgi:probable HAF family extracellular repeat protein
MTQLALLRWLVSCAALLPITIAAVHTQTTSHAPRQTAATERMMRDVTVGRPAPRSVDAPTSQVDDGTLLYSEPDPSLAIAAADAKRKYFITDIGTLGGTQSFALGINDVGQVFGTSWITGDTTQHAFLYQNGTMADLGDLVITLAGGALNNSGQIAGGFTLNGVVRPAIYDTETGIITIIPALGGTSPSGFRGVVRAINNRSKAVGFAYIDSQTTHAFSHRDGVTRDIGSLGGSSYAASINDSGTIVGASTDASNGFAHAFVFSAGQMRDIDPFGDPTFTKSLSVANDVNDAGAVVGYFLDQTDGAIHSFLFDGDNFINIGVAGSPETNASAINNQGQVVGGHLVFDERVCQPICENRYKMHAFLYEGGDRITDLNALTLSQPGWEFTWAFDINNHGQIIGYGVLDNNFRAFVLTPAVHKRQCKHGGWKGFGFKNQGQCVQFVNN